MIDLQNLNKFYLDDFVKDYFIGFYQALFSQNKGEFHFDPDKELTRINISDQFAVDDLTPEFKPTIYIRRKPLVFMNTSIDQFAGGDLMTSSKRYTDLISGTVEIVCVAQEGLEAARLAGLIFLLTTQFKDELRKHGMFDVSVKALGEEEPRDVRSTFRVVEVPVAVQIMFQYSWAVTTMNLLPLADVEVARSSDVTTGETLVGVPNDGCNGQSGVSIGDVNTDGQDVNEGAEEVTKLCIPMTSASPKRIE